MTSVVIIGAIILATILIANREPIPFWQAKEPLVGSVIPHKPKSLVFCITLTRIGNGAGIASIENSDNLAIFIGGSNLFYRSDDYNYYSDNILLNQLGTCQVAIVERKNTITFYLKRQEKTIKTELKLAKPIGYDNFPLILRLQSVLDETNYNDSIGFLQNVRAYSSSLSDTQVAKLFANPCN